jgi:hypothetical protein
MRNLILLIAALGCSIFSVQGQQNATFEALISTDSILMDNVVKLSFVLENAEGSEFDFPELNGNFDIISGPNTMSSMSMINGKVSQSVTYTFYLKPREVGQYVIPAASVKVKGKVMETSPLEVKVHPNPDGVKVEPDSGETDPFSDFKMDLRSPFFLPELGKPEKPVEEPKKKRKTVKL